MLQRIELHTGGAECNLTFEFGRLLKEGGSIFDPEAKFSPAVLHLKDVLSIGFDGVTAYQLNSTVVNHDAIASSREGYIEYSFELTGGTDPRAFMAKLTFLAKDFVFGGSNHL